MSQKDRADWDERFRTGDHGGTEPDQFLNQLEEYRELFPANGRALDIACGAGRHAVWLAQKGWEVTACDISIEGLHRAKSLAAEHGVLVNLFCQDLETGFHCLGRFDLIVCFFYLQRELFPVLKSSLKPNGLIVYKTYTTDQKKFPNRPRRSAHLLQPQELLEEFRDFRVLFYEEVLKDRGVAKIIAQKK